MPEIQDNQKQENEKEERVHNIALAYYSRPEIQKAIFDFCKNRETVPRKFDIFGKRPQTIEYPNEIFQLVKSGYTSFHCSEEIWSNPLELATGLRQEQLNSLRTGWDLLIDIDCKWFEFSKLACESVITVLKNHGIKNIGVKFSGGKGFHIIVPWNSFPKEINNQETKNLFPEVARKIVSYIRNESEKILKNNLPENVLSQFSKVNIKKGVKCTSCNEIANEYEQRTYLCKRCKREEVRRILKDESKQYKCPECRKEFELKDSKKIYECKKCLSNSEKSPESFSSSIELDLFELMGLDIVLVSPRHLFRAPYSLHEKGLVSVVIDISEIKDFDPRLASPLRVKIKNFYPSSEENEAKELLVSALDWDKEHNPSREDKKTFTKPIQQVKIDKSRIVYPPCISAIMNGLEDGKKRAVFILINYFLSLNLEFDEIEKTLFEWNKKNKPELKDGYILSQLSWAKRQKKMLPPNCDKDFYKGIAVCNPDNLCRKIKNPVNYTIIKSLKKSK